jgi:hypothetical protein
MLIFGIEQKKPNSTQWLKLWICTYLDVLKQMIEFRNEQLVFPILLQFSIKSHI